MLQESGLHLTWPCSAWSRLVCFVAGERVASDVALQCRDVLIVGTQKAFQFAMPAASFLVALKKHGFKVAVNTTREEGGWGVAV